MSNALYIMAIVAAVAILGMATMTIDYTNRAGYASSVVTDDADVSGDAKTAVSRVRLTDDFTASVSLQKSSCSVVANSNGKSISISLLEKESTSFAGIPISVKDKGVLSSESCQVMIDGKEYALTKGVPVSIGSMTIVVRDISLR